MTKALLPLLLLAAIGAAPANAQIYALGATPGAERDLYTEAENRLLKHDYELALDRFESFIRQYPLSQYVPDAQFRRAVSLYRLGQYKSSLDLFNRIEERYRSTRYLSSVPFWKGVDQYYLAQYEPAIGNLNRFLANTAVTTKGNGEDATLRRQALLYRGISEIASGKGGDAIASLTQMMNETLVPSEESYGLTLLCSLDRDAKRWSDIERLYERTDVSKVDARWAPQFRLYAAEAYYATGDLPKAESIYRSLESATADVAAVALERLFAIARTAGDEEGQARVLASAESALAGRTDILSQFWLRIGIENYQQKKYDLAELYFQRLWDLRKSERLPGTVPLYLAQMLVMRGRKEQALSVLEDYLAQQWVKDAQGAAGTTAPEAGPVPSPKTVSTSGANKTDASSLPTDGFGTGAIAAVDTYRDRVLARAGSIDLSLEKWNNAKDLLQTVINDYPDSPLFAQASYQRAYAIYRLGDYQSALQAIRDLFAAGKSGELTADALRLQAACQEKLGEASAAVDSLDQYLAMRKDDLTARLDLVRVLFQDKNYGRVVSQGKAIFKENPDLAVKREADAAQLHYEVGLSYIAAKDYSSAISELSGSAVPTSQSGVYAYKLYYLGWAYYRLGRFDDAVTAYGELIRGYPTNALSAQAAYLAGWCSFSTGKYADAEHYLRLVAGYDAPQSLIVDASFLLGQSLVEQKKFQQAQSQFLDIFTTYPTSSLADDAMYEYASSFADLNMIDRAAAAYADLVKRYPESPLSPQALYRRAELYYNDSRFREAQDAFFLYRSSFPVGAQIDGALYWGGMASLKDNEPTGALLLWERLIADRSNSSYRSDAMYRAAQVYESRGDFKNALNLYSELLARYPDRAKAVDAQKEVDTLVLQMNGLSRQEATLLVSIDSAGKASTAEGRDGILKLARIVIYQESAASSNLQLVLPLLSQVVDHRKDDPRSAGEAQYLLGEVAARQSDYLKAANSFLDAAAIDPVNRDRAAQSLYRAAEMLKMAGRLDQTKALVKRITDTFAGSRWASDARNLLEQ
ncbi:MAG TPA: tetratricopeptide repeat protein [Spirochaetia bacterium]|nr:tetratricopeptide repeat protein [Spirochaetia bacterium]